MGSAKKCDRCGGLYEEYALQDSEDNLIRVVKFKINTSGALWSQSDYFDVLELCPKCKRHIDGWVQREKI